MITYPNDLYGLEERIVKTKEKIHGKKKTKRKMF